MTRGDRSRPTASANPEAQQEDGQRAQRAADEAAEQKLIAEVDAEKARTAKKREEVRKAEIAKYKAMSPAQRMKELRESCTVESCNDYAVDQLTEAAASDGERKALERAAEGARRAGQDRGEVQVREGIAKDVDQYLLDQHMNPNGVAAVGPKKTTLQIKMFLCTRQFVNDFYSTPIASQARQAGFKRILCTDGSVETVTQEW